MLRHCNVQQVKLAAICVLSAPPTATDQEDHGQPHVRDAADLRRHRRARRAGGRHDRAERYRVVSEPR